MRMPGFTAEVVIEPAAGFYTGNAIFAQTGRVEIAPMQGMSAGPRRARAMLRNLTSVLPVKKCCQYSPVTRRIECTSRVQPPGYQCDCIRTLTFPAIVCRPAVFARI